MGKSSDTAEGIVGATFGSALKLRGVSPPQNSLEAQAVEYIEKKRRQRVEKFKNLFSDIIQHDVLATEEAEEAMIEVLAERGRIGVLAVREVMMNGYGLRHKEWVDDYIKHKLPRTVAEKIIEDRAYSLTTEAAEYPISGTVYEMRVGVLRPRSRINGPNGGKA